MTAGSASSLTASVPYVILARLDRPIGAWLLFLPGLWSILLPRAPWGQTIRLIILFAIGSVVMRSAGCVVNDMWDRKIDRMVERTAGRPLASGALSMRQAAAFLVLLLAIGLAILLSLNHAAQLLGASSLILVAPVSRRQARHLVAAGHARANLRLRRAAGLCRRNAAFRCGRACPLCRRLLLDSGL